jgi:iron-sulfur cluster repair protein YtfE (RIC family)
MKKMLKSVPDAKHCVERSELEQILASRFKSLEGARSALLQETTNTNSNNNPLLIRVKSILSQDRDNVINFEHYTPSPEHQERMQRLAKLAPNLYENPSLTPRSKWFSHPMWHRNSQMPPYHVHFRHELQDVTRYLYEAYSASAPKPQSRALRNAHSQFTGSMRGLNGHVSIEEYACFPMYQKTFPAVDITFLYQDHKELHRSEKKVENILASLIAQNPSLTEMLPRDDIVSALELVLNFDDQLMAHLGEEEEIVVPMSLTDKEIWF